MTENIMQCCYTNAVSETGGKIRSGWQVVSATEGIPSEAYKNCVNLQNANSTLQSHMVDERGNVLNLLEIVGDGAYVYVIRTQYGLTDRLGRPNMFSHAYIFSWKQEKLISDPNLFLTLTGNNFAQSEEAARQSRETLERAEPFTLERALERAEMTAETYVTLIQCVYTQYTEKKATRPLYVQYDGTEEQMQAILYCVYYGLPYCVRRCLNVASAAANTPKNRNLIFSVEAAGHDSYLIPRTGENNILTARIERRLARCGFVEYAVRQYADLDADAYFQQLEQLAAELSDCAPADELVLKIAHQLRETPEFLELTEEELSSRLSDALRSKTFGSRRMEEYISSMLEEICRREMPLTEESEANLAERLVSPVTEQLAAAGEQYNIYRLGTLSLEEAVRLLHKMAPPVFDRYRQVLAENDKGLLILDNYYAAYGLEDREITWEALDTLWTETGYLSSREKTLNTIDAAAWELYRKQVETPETAWAAFHSLMRLMERLLPPEQLSDCREVAKNDYWEQRTLSSFSYSRLDEYKEMCANTKQYEQFRVFCQVIDAYSQSGEEAFLRELNSFANQYTNVFNKPQLTKEFRQKLEDELLAVSPDAAKLTGWMDVVTHPDAQLILDDILQLRTMAHSRSFDGFAESFRRITQNASSEDVTSLARLLGRILTKECQAADTPEHWVPLDVWLSLGEVLHPGNMFWIFDDVAACVTGVEESQAVSGSGLLRMYHCVQQAEEYIQNKGSAAKTVHRWLSELRAAERRRHSEERKQRKEADGSMLDRGRALISQFAFGGESKSGKHLAGKNKSDTKKGFFGR